MPITKRPPTGKANTPADPAAAERFIAAAPDAGQAAPQVISRSNVVRSKQVQIAFALPPELLVKVDAAADGLSISRAAFIKQALTRAVMAESN